MNFSGAGLTVVPIFSSKGQRSSYRTQLGGRPRIMLAWANILLVYV